MCACWEILATRALTNPITRRYILRATAIVIAAVVVAYTFVSVEDDTSAVLLWLCAIVIMRGLYKSIIVLRRVFIERQQTWLETDRSLQLIAGENVRRHSIQIVKLIAFGIIVAIPLAGYSNQTISRSLLLLILFLVSGQAELDADAIADFDRMRARQKAEEAQ